MSDDNSDKPTDIARNIWLAGLGAYGKAIRDAQGKLEEAAKEPPRLFRELVEKGSRLEDDVRDSLSTMRKTGSLSVEERISRVRDSFHLNIGRSDDIEAINARLDALEKKLDALTASTGKPKRKAATRKAAAKKATASTRKKSAAKKKTPAKKKPISKKAPASKKAPNARKAPARRKAPAKKAPARRKSR